jgi:predicted RNA-binding protein with PUA-like domain
MTQFWALKCNPNYYEIEKSIVDFDTEWWTTKKRGIKKGDQVLIWKTLGKKDGHRGIIVLGEAISDPMLRDESNNPYWNNYATNYPKEERIAIRYIRSPNLPIWVGEGYDDILLNLGVARATGGTVFKVTADQWEDIQRTVGTPTN